MRKVFKIVFTAIVICALTIPQAKAADQFTDSLLKIINGNGNIQQRIDASIELAKDQYYSLNAGTEFVSTLQRAINIAKSAGSVREEARARYWLSSFTFGAGEPSAIAMIKNDLTFAQQNKFSDVYADLLILLARANAENADSVNLLLKQAMAISETNKLVLQNAKAKVFSGLLQMGVQTDSGRQVMGTGLAMLDSKEYAYEKYLLLRTIARSWLFAKSDSAKVHMLNLIKFCRENDMRLEEIIQLQQMSFSQSPTFLPDSMQKFYQRIRTLTRELKKDSVNYMSVYVQTSQDIGNNNAALQTGFRLLQMAEQRKDSALKIMTYYGLGLSYEYSFDYENAIVYFHKALPLKNWNEFMYLFALDDLARCHQKLGNADSARFYAAACYKFATEYYKGESMIFGGVLNDLGITYFDLGDDSIAHNYLQRSLRFYQDRMSFESKNFTLTTNALANYYQKHNEPDSVRLYALMSLGEAQRGGFLENITGTSNLLAQYYKERNRMDSAFFYQNLSFEAYKKQYGYKTSREYQRLISEEQRRVEAAEFNEKLAAQKYSDNLKVYGLLGLLLVAIIVGGMIFRNNKQRKRSYELLKVQKQEIDVQKIKLEETVHHLNTTQKQLVQSEKMASLGELTAGIAHEIQNPLNFVNNFSEVSRELIDELKSQKEKLKTEEQEEILNDIDANLEKINHHGKRADAIVKGMLQHSQSGKGQKELTDINALADEYLRLSYHGLRAKDNSFNATLKTDFDNSIGKINIVPQDFGRVLLNLYNNAFYAVNEKKKSVEPSVTNYEPTVSIVTKKVNGKIEIRVGDNGNGIGQNIVDKIFQPFFTTKPTGQGTGLGLSLSYDIVKAHQGEIKVQSSKEEGTEFIVQLPTN